METTIQPVRTTVTVNRARQDAFRIFTDEIASWWPLGSHSVGGERAAAAVFEAHAGGRVFERTVDGREHEWGRVLVYEPPHRLVFSWHPGRPAHEATEVELTFHERDGRTEVHLEHRGWERLGDRGPSVRDQYDAGWPVVLAPYARAAG